ncbi:hypothetical protein HanRHA438_Chr17g0818391 [Helianthus annuus]|uniref:Uncharacterized protein n=1 Tax=Helianthus annuus TaxID=4232 RepID=A0A9K3GUR2_HELAN|nr:hypothetical protein HanXRQr2_Chr17g0808641 [Helianthus annuus]KAJ0826800.1 hypothetical protein HanRHA438_Chr17g0818391 [Helianthus annuus]
MELKNQPNIENEYYDSKQKICNIGTDPCGRERVRNKETSFFFRSPE